MYLLGVQASVAHQFSAEQQHRYFMSIAHFRRVVGVDVEHVDREAAGFRQCREFAQHFLAQAAAGARVQQEARRA